METTESNEIEYSPVTERECKRQVIKFGRKVTLCRDEASANCGFCSNHCQIERCEAHVR